MARQRRKAIAQRLEAMETFVRVIKANSFSAAAAQLELSRSIVTKRVMQMEAVLGAKLINRTTRRLSVTEIGEHYYQFCTRILDEIKREDFDIQRLLRQPQGRLKVLASKSFGSLHMGQAIASFVARYPDVKVSLLIGDVSMRSLDPVEHGFDVAVRLTDLPDSRLYSRRIGTVRWITCAAPEYLQSYGQPQVPADLERHLCIIHQTYAADGQWQFRGPQHRAIVKVSGPVTTNSIIVMRRMVLEGCGIALLPTYCVADDLKKGRLLPLLPEYLPPDQPIVALYPYGQMQPRKVRLFVDHLAQRFRKPQWEQYLQV
jgi:DNA-binding transcriptional LysR family regulator